MARISTYVKDDEVNPNDIVIGSEHSIDNAGRVTYKTKNYRMVELQTFFQGSNFTATAPINLTGTTNKVWSHDDITIITTNSANPAGITLQDNTTFITATDVSFGGLSKHVNGFTRKEFTLPNYQFQISTSNNGSHNRIVDIDSASPGTGLDELHINSGTVINTRLSAENTITIDHSPRVGTDATADTDISYGGTFLALSARSITSEGHWSDNTLTTYTLPTYSFNVRGDNTDATQAITNSNTLIIAGTAPISTTSSDTDTVTITHDDITHTASDSGTTVNLTYGGNFTALTARTVSAQGHLTASTLTTYAVPAQYSFNIHANATVASSPAFNKQITSGQTLNILGGTNLGSTVSANDTVTINHDAFSTTTSAYGDGSPGIPGFGGNFTVLSGLTPSNGHITNIESIQINFPSLTTSDGTFIDLTANSNTDLDVELTADLSAGGTPNSSTFLRGDNQWATPPGTYTLPIATSSIRGGIELRYDTNLNNSANAATSVAGRTYGLQLNSNNQAVINVPWTDSQLSTEAVQDIVGAMFSSNTETRISATYQDGDGTIDLAVDDMTANTQNTTTLSFVDSTNDIILRNTTGGAGSGSDDIKFVAGSNITLTHTDADNITIASTDTNTTYSANSGVDLAGTVFSLDVTSTSANSFFQIPFFNSAANALSRDVSTSSSIFFNPNSNTLSVKQISLGTTSTLTARSIYSQSSGSNYFEIANTSTSNGGRLLFGCTSSGFNGIYSRNHNNSAGREFRLIQLSNTVITVATSGNTTVDGTVTATNFIVGSDRRIKSEIEPIKEGLEVIKQFTSYNYIKGGEKESGFIAQEVQQVLPHTVYEDKEGMLSMSDRGVLAHMHKAILELEERLTAIEEKLN